jgi:GAF domain-containing protein
MADQPLLLTYMQAANDIVQGLAPLAQEKGSCWQYPKHLAQRLAEGLVNRLGSATAQIWYYNPDEQTFNSVAWAGLRSPAYAYLETLYPDGSPLGEIIKQGEPVLSNTPADEPWILAPDWVRETGLQGFAAYPITLGSDPVGALAIFSYHSLESEFLEVLKFICSYTASAIVNARQTGQLRALFEQTRQQKEREALINRIANTVHQSLHWDEIVSTAMQAIQETLELSRCCFLAVLPGERIQATHEARHENLPPILGPYQLQDFGPFRERIAQGNPVQMSDLCQESELPLEGHIILQQLQIQSGVLIPVHSNPAYTFDEQPTQPKRELIGLVGAFKAIPYSWQGEEVELLQSLTHQLAIALTKAQLLQRARQQADRLTLLNSMTAVIRSSLDPSTLFHAITQQIGEAFHVDVCTLALLEPEDKGLRPVGIYAPQLAPAELEEVLPGVTLFTELTEAEILPHSYLDPWREQLLRTHIPSMVPDSTRQKLRFGSQLLMESLTPIVLSDLDTPVAEVESAVRRIPNLDPHSIGMVLVPLLQGDQLMGCLSLKQYHTLRRWQATDLQLAEAVAQQAAIAISQARLLTKTQQQAEQASMLNRMMDRIRCSLNLDEILQAAVEEIGRALQASRAQFVFVDPDGKSALCRHAYAQPGVDCLLHREIPIQGQCLDLGLDEASDPILIKTWSDQEDQDPECRKRFQDADVQSMILARFALGGHHYGVLSVHQCTTGKSRRWTLAEQDLLKMVAEQLTIAINQAHLYEKTIQQARRETLLNEITTQIRTSLDPQQVLQAIVQSLASTLNLDHCQISLYREDLNASPTDYPWLHPKIIPQLRLGEVVVLPKDLRENPLESFFRTEGIHSLAVIPIRQAGELRGAIAMMLANYDHWYPREFQADELSLALAVAEQAGIALQQAELYEQTRISALRESLLRQVAQQLSSTYDPRQVIQYALQGMANALQVETCAFIGVANALDSGSSSEKAIGTDPLPDKGLQLLLEYQAQNQKFSQVKRPLSSDLSWLILLQCYGRHKSLRIEDVNQYPVSAQARRTLVQEIHSLLCVPVLTDNTTVAGVLCAWIPPEKDPGQDLNTDPSITLNTDHPGVEVSDPEGRPFDHADMELIETLAGITAVALERAQFYDQARRQEATAAAVRGLTEGREAESRRLAADLHDQTLADLGALFRQIQHLMWDESIGEPGRQQLQKMTEQLGETITELRGIVEDLQPTAMRAFNLGSALRSLLERAAQRSTSPLITRFDDCSDELLNRLDPVVQSTLFRIVQEALNNVVKHAQARRIDVIISKLQVQADEPFLEVKIIDDGQGMPKEMNASGRHGLLNMRYRAELIGATIEWRQRRTGTGTVVHLLIPLSTPPDLS